MVPTVEFPPTILSTLQVTFCKDAVNCWVCVVVVTAARAGDTVMPAANALAAENSIAANTHTHHNNLNELLMLPPPKRRYSEHETSTRAQSTLLRRWLNQFRVDG